MHLQLKRFLILENPLLLLWNFRTHFMLCRNDSIPDRISTHSSIDFLSGTASFLYKIRCLMKILLDQTESLLAAVGISFNIYLLLCFETTKINVRYCIIYFQPGIHHNFSTDVTDILNCFPVITTFLQIFLFAYLCTSSSLLHVKRITTGFIAL